MCPIINADMSHVEKVNCAASLLESYFKTSVPEDDDQILETVSTLVHKDKILSNPMLAENRENLFEIANQIIGVEEGQLVSLLICL